jgi:hypothetical protein
MLGSLHCLLSSAVEHSPCKRAVNGSIPLGGSLGSDSVPGIGVFAFSSRNDSSVSDTRRRWESGIRIGGADRVDGPHLRPSSESTPFVGGVDSNWGRGFRSSMRDRGPTTSPRGGIRRAESSLTPSTVFDPNAPGTNHQPLRAATCREAHWRTPSPNTDQSRAPRGARLCSFHKPGITACLASPRKPSNPFRRRILSPWPSRVPAQPTADAPSR